MVRVVTKNDMRAALSGFVSLVCSGLPLAAQAVELAAHEATYNMSLLSVEQDSQMAGIKGKTSLLFAGIVTAGNHLKTMSLSLTISLVKQLSWPLISLHGRSLQDSFIRLKCMKGQHLTMRRSLMVMQTCRR